MSYRSKKQKSGKVSTFRKYEHYSDEVARQKLAELTEFFDVGTPDPKYVEVQLEELRKQGKLLSPFSDFIFSNSSYRALTHDEENLFTLLLNQLSNAELAQIKRIRILRPSIQPSFGPGLPSDTEYDNYQREVLQIRIRDIRPGLIWYHETGHALYDSLDESTKENFNNRWTNVPNRMNLWESDLHHHLNPPNEAFAELKATYILGSPYTRATGTIRQMLGDDNAMYFEQLMKSFKIEGSIDQ